MNTQVLIIDDYSVYREGLKLLIEKMDHFSVVGEAEDAQGQFALMDSLRPDFVILNLMLPKNIVLPVCHKLYNEFTNTRLIVSASKINDELLVECAFKRADAIIKQDSKPEQIIEALNEVRSGKRFINLELLHAMKEQKTTEDKPQNLKINLLSNRENEVIKLFGKGLSYKEIANELGISPRTVESHKNNILEKLELRTVKELISYIYTHLNSFSDN